MDKNDHIFLLFRHLSIFGRIERLHENLSRYSNQYIKHMLSYKTWELRGRTIFSLVMKSRIIYEKVIAGFGARYAVNCLQCTLCDENEYLLYNEIIL